MVLEQVRRNDRSLQKFYDAKYIDSRTREKPAVRKPRFEKARSQSHGKIDQVSEKFQEAIRTYEELSPKVISLGRLIESKIVKDADQSGMRKEAEETNII